ncbi:MAG: hypothetical protein PHW96_00620 [Candidatus Nanoarchaeia archaeon]|nr:hypothetical protein [Candidatus Nanoarchaeia archaeon]
MSEKFADEIEKLIDEIDKNAELNRKIYDISITIMEDSEISPMGKFTDDGMTVGSGVYKNFL